MPEKPKSEPVDEHKGHTSIQGRSVVDYKNMVEFVKHKSPYAKDIEEIAKAFINVGEKYNIRGDIAFCQSIIETGWFKFDGGTTVTPDQHNYCGLGVVSKGVKGNSFNTVDSGVTAQIQHLFAYACKDPIPNSEFMIDPRFKYVSRGVAPHWEDLSNRWAMNANYGNHILAMYEQLKNFKYEQKEETIVEKPVDIDEHTQQEDEGKKKSIIFIIDYFFNKLAEFFGKK